MKILAEGEKSMLENISCSRMWRLWWFSSISQCCSWKVEWDGKTLCVPSLCICIHTWVGQETRAFAKGLLPAFGQISSGIIMRKSKVVQKVIWHNMSYVWKLSVLSAMHSSDGPLAVTLVCPFPPSLRLQGFGDDKAKSWQWTTWNEMQLLPPHYYPCEFVRTGHGLT